MSVTVAEDRSMCVQPHQLVRTAWVDIDLCRLGFRMPMSPEAVEKKFRRLLNLGDCAPWPPVVGHWEGERFLVDDGRHEYLAALMLGRDRLFVCWLEAAPATVVEQNRNTSPALQPVGSLSAISSARARTVALSDDDRLPAASRGFWPRFRRKTARASVRQERAEEVAASSDPPRPPALDQLRA